MSIVKVGRISYIPFPQSQTRESSNRPFLLFRGLSSQAGELGWDQVRLRAEDLGLDYSLYFVGMGSNHIRLPVGVPEGGRVVSIEIEMHGLRP